MKVIHQSHQPCIPLLLVALLLPLLVWLLLAQVWSAEAQSGLDETVSDMSPATAANELTPTNCRYGVGYISEAIGAEAWMPTVHAGWFINFSGYPMNVPGSEFVYTLRVRQDRPQVGVRLPTYTYTPPLDVIEDFLLFNPGAIWLIGNEIEINNAVQDNIMPDIYAKAYHEAYHFIKGVDPTARVAIGSVTMATPGRLQYLDIVWDTYSELFGAELPVDVWNFHLYIMAERNRGNFDDDGKVALGTDPLIAILSSHDDPNLCPHPDLPDTPENDPAHDVYCRAERDSLRIYREQLYAMRQWMKVHGLQDIPLIISEYGSLPDYQPGTPEEPCGHARPDEFGRCMFPERVTDYLQGTSALMNETADPELGYPQDDYRLVQRWLWYSLYTPFRIGGSSNLLVENYYDYSPGVPDALTMVGRAFRDEALAPTAKPNLVAGEGHSTTIFVENPDDLGSAVLRVSFRNAGDLSIVEPFAITFFRDAALRQPIGSAVVDPTSAGPLLGCAWTPEDGSQSVTVTWPDLPVGTHRYWVQVDSAASVVELDESDNVTAGTVTVYAENEFQYDVYLSAVRGE